MARTITGRRTPPRFTTGPATRHALAAAGALGATTGSVVHLAASPTGHPASSSVLAHELAHTRRQVSRPRFLLAGAGGPADQDEREALAVGHGPLGTIAAPEGPVGAGIVGQLPVGAGVGSLADIAVNAARVAVFEAAAATAGSSAEHKAGFGSTGGFGNPGGTAGGGTGGAAGGTAGGGTGGTADGTAGGDAGDTASGGPGSAGAGGSATTTPASTPGGPPAPPSAAGVPLDPDRIVELVEERLLREIERRGGRWAGVF